MDVKVKSYWKVELKFIPSRKFIGKKNLGERQRNIEC
jgi:hypothetical protein